MCEHVLKQNYENICSYVIMVRVFFLNLKYLYQRRNLFHKNLSKKKKIMYLCYLFTVE